MTRWSKRFFGVIWLFMLALLVAMWVRSYWLDDLWAFSSPQNYSRVQSSGGEIGYTWATSILWSSDPATFVGNALSPSKVVSVQVVDARAKTARVVVPDFQLSLAIGKEGQNARLAARLTGWKIDIRSDAEPAATQPARVSRAEVPVTNAGSPPAAPTR